MPTPAVTFGFILATIYGAVFHLVVGGDIRRLALYLLAGWLGFAVGDLTGALLDVTLFKTGQIHMLSATVGAWTALFAARMLLSRPARRR